MKAVYKCMHCDAAVSVTVDADALSPQHALNLAYDARLVDAQLRTGLTPYRPHECEPGILGVAQLVAIRDD